MDQRSLKWQRQTVKEMHLKENTFFDLDHGIKVTLNIVQQLLYHVSYSPAKLIKCCPVPLHYVTYAAAKFEAATCNGLGRDAFT